MRTLLFILLTYAISLHFGDSIRTAGAQESATPMLAIYRGVSWERKVSTVLPGGSALKVVEFILPKIIFFSHPDIEGGSIMQLHVELVVPAFNNTGVKQFDLPFIRFSKITKNGIPITFPYYYLMDQKPVNTPIETWVGKKMPLDPFPKEFASVIMKIIGEEFNPSFVAESVEKLPGSGSFLHVLNDPVALGFTGMEVTKIREKVYNTIALIQTTGTNDTPTVDLSYRGVPIFAPGSLNTIGYTPHNLTGLFLSHLFGSKIAVEQITPGNSLHIPTSSLSRLVAEISPPDQSRESLFVATVKDVGEFMDQNLARLWMKNEVCTSASIPAADSGG